MSCVETLGHEKKTDYTLNYTAQERVESGRYQVTFVPKYDIARNTIAVIAPVENSLKCISTYIKFSLAAIISNTR